jgi:parvulin-like peptidyl-prolyl isomerase
MREGDVSNPIRIDNWRHIIKVEQRIAAEDVPLEDVRHELETRLRQRLIEPEMQRISAELFNQANIAISDAALRADFFERHPELTRSAP